jgi:Flp pilus assembly protein TadG
VRAWFTRRSSYRHERGTTLIEFALVFPILVALLFGMIDGGRFIAARATLAQAAAVGVRTACLQDAALTPADVRTAVAASAMTLSGISVTWPPDCAPAAGCTGALPIAPGTTVVLTTSYDFQAGFFKSFSKTMTQKSRMVCE